MSSNPEATAKRARSSAAIMIATLAILAAVVVLASNSLSWPLASELQNFISPPEPLGFSNSSLLVSGASFVPTLPCSQGNSSCVIQNARIRVPIASAPVTIYAFAQQSRLEAVARNTTNANGMQLFLLRPGTYEVTIDTTQLGNISAIVTTSPKNTTELDVNINQSTYTCTFFESTNSLSPNLITPWDPIYMSVQGPSPLVQNSNNSVYIEFLRSAEFITNGLSLQTSPQTYGIKIINQYSSQAGTFSLQAQLANSIVNTSDTLKIYVLSYLLSYSTKEYAMLTNVTETLPFPGAFP